MKAGGSKTAPKSTPRTDTTGVDPADRANPGQLIADGITQLQGVKIGRR